MISRKKLLTTTGQRSPNRQQSADSEKLSQNQPSPSDPHILYTPGFYISGEVGYVAAPSAGYALPQQSKIQQTTVSTAATSSGEAQQQTSVQHARGNQQAITTRTQSDLYKMQTKKPQIMYVPQNTTNNNSDKRNQSTSGNVYRTNPSNPTPRNIYIHSPMYPAVHQGLLLGQFTAPYVARTPQMQPCQYSPQYFPPMYCPYYIQPPSQQQTAIVNPALAVGLNNSMPLQPSGPVCGPTFTNNQAQIPLRISPGAASSVLSVAKPTVTQPVEVAALLRMSHQLSKQQNPAQTRAKLRSRALEIIDPVTQRNILEDKNEATNNYVSTSEINKNSFLDSESGSITKIPASTSLAVKLNENSKTSRDVVKPGEPLSSHLSCDVTDIEKNIIKAKIEPIKTEAPPSIENFPLQPQRQRTKKSQNISAVKQNRNSYQSRKVHNIKHGTDVSITVNSNFNCEQEMHPACNCTNQQVPTQQEQIELPSSSKETNSQYISSDLNQDCQDVEGIDIADDDLQLKELEYNLKTNNSSENLSNNSERTRFESGAESDGNMHTDEPPNQTRLEDSISYNEDQWAPSNPIGKKQYNREQLMLLREVKASRIQPNVKNTSIFSQTNLMPAFASCSNKKVQSMVVSLSGTRGSNSGTNQNNYIKQGPISNRGADSGHHNRNSGKAIIHLNLSLNQDVKLNEADNAWRPRVLLKVTDQNSQCEQDELIRRVRGILNKLTPEKFEPLVREIIKLKIDTMEKMEAVMILVFEKAIDEPNFSVSYASLCNRLINEVKARDERMESETKSNLAYFRKALLDKTEREFTQNVTKTSAKEEKLKPLIEKIDNCQDPNEIIELEALLDEEERKIRRRSGGTVRFIGELFKISILSGKIINTCIEALLKDPENEDMLECLCKLLTTVGQIFEQTHIPKTNKRKYSLESVIHRMQNIVSKNENSKISSRVRFMLQDVIDLHKKKWQSTNNETPKTMEQIEKEANNEHLSNQYQYANLISSGKGGSNKREDRVNRNEGRSRNHGGSHRQREDTDSLKRHQAGSSDNASQARQLAGNAKNDDTWHVKTSKGNRSLAVDSSKLIGLTAVDVNNKKMGGASLFQWSKNSSQLQTSAAANSFAALSKRGCDMMDRGSSDPNKGSMERPDRFDRDRLCFKSSPTQAISEENTSTRKNQGSVRCIGGNSSNRQKSISHSKYQQSIASNSSSRMTTSKMYENSTGKSSLYRDSQQQSLHHALNTTHHQQHFKLFTETHSLPQSLPITPAVFEKPNDLDFKTFKAVVIEMVENTANSKCIDNATISCFKKIKDNQHCGLLYYILTDYLHLGKVDTMSRRHLANDVVYLIEKKHISLEDFHLAYKHFSEVASDLMVDIPELWMYIFEFTGPFIVKKLLTPDDLWSPQLRESGSSSFSLKFIKNFLQYCTRDVGPSFTRCLWKKHYIQWTSFMEENEVKKFIQTNKFEYVENENIQPDIDSKESKVKRYKRVVEHIEQLLKEDANAGNLIDYINGNIIEIDKIFIKNLTTTLTSFAIKNSCDYSLDLNCFQKICIPVLRRYLDSKEELELECLSAIQLLIYNLQQPIGLLEIIFGELNDGDVIPQETFRAWRDSMDQSPLKAEAIKDLVAFFNQVISSETGVNN